VIGKTKTPMFLFHSVSLFPLSFLPLIRLEQLCHIQILMTLTTHLFLFSAFLFAHRDAPTLQRPFESTTENLFD
jgi:hypothetical protein